MTYQSFRIQVLDQGQLEPEEPTYETRATKFLNLDDFASCNSIPTLSGWAACHGAPCRYVDNCWVRVEVSPEQLLAFLIDVSGVPESTIEVVRTRMSEAFRYVIVMEEF
jgi:hypothetical protein